MAKNPPYKTLGASVLEKYKSFVPKTEHGSTRYNNLQSSAKRLKQLKNFDYKMDNAGRQKRSSVEAMIKIINK